MKAQRGRTRAGRTPILLLAAGLAMAACEDSGGPAEASGGPSTDGTLIVSTSTTGGDPDPDGFQLTVDDGSPTDLDPTGTAEVGIPAGVHSLRLLDVADHCSVAPGTPLTVDIAPRSTTPVAFAVSCPAIGARVTVTTTGLDLDPDGYRVAVDGADRGAVSANGTMLIRLDPGTRPFDLTGLEANCTAEGSGSRQVTIVDGAMAEVDFAVVCTGTSGVIGVVVEAWGADVNGGYKAMVDGANKLLVEPSGPAYLTGVSAGDHMVSLDAPPNCSVENNPQSVTVTTGGLVRDTVEVTFVVTCTNVHGNVQITAATTGLVPPSARYRVMHETFGYWDYGGPVTELGFLDPNGTLVAHVDTGEYWANYWHVFRLEDVPSNCSVSDPHPYPNPGFHIGDGDVLNVEFEITCSP